VLLANDRPGPPNEGGQVLRIVALGPAQFGGVAMVAGKVVYTPAPDFNGVDTFTYTIDDGDPASTAVGTVTVNVSAVDDPPIATDDFVTTAEDTPRTIPVLSLLWNDRPGPPDEMGQTVRIVPNGFGAPAHGTISYNGASVVYTPNRDFFGTDTFTYTIDDGNPASTAVGTVTVTVTPVNDPPVAGNDQVTTAEDTPLTLPVSMLLANDRPGPANESNQTLRITVRSPTTG
jgi:large repetitive protein